MRRISLVLVLVHRKEGYARIEGIRDSPTLKEIMFFLLLIMWSTNMCRYSEIKDYTFGQEPCGGPVTGSPSL